MRLSISPRLKLDVFIELTDTGSRWCHIIANLKTTKRSKIGFDFDP